MAPVFAAKASWLHRFGAPIDGGRMFRGKRILGDHKTWRGLVAGIVAATLVLALQQGIVSHYGWFAQVIGEANIMPLDDTILGVAERYAALPVLLLGPLFAIGALGGDALKSFLKRQVGVAPGKSWFPFDQLDFIIGGALAIALFIRFSFLQYLLLISAWLILNMAVTYLGWLLKLKDAPV